MPSSNVGGTVRLSPSRVRLHTCEPTNIYVWYGVRSALGLAAGAYLRAMKVRVTREIDKDEGRLRALVTQEFDRMHVDEWQYSPDSPDSVMLR